LYTFLTAPQGADCFYDAPNWNRKELLDYNKSINIFCRHFYGCGFQPRSRKGTKKSKMQILKIDADLFWTQGALGIFSHFSASGQSTGVNIGPRKSFDSFGKTQERFG
jgi:hypothetical protein